MAKNASQLPLGRSHFPALRDSGALYVDKTRLVADLAKVDGKLFLARPRRFGKSLLVSTFETLFANGLRDFQGLAIEPRWKDKTYQVVRLDFAEVKAFRTLDEFSERFSAYIALRFARAGFACAAGLDAVLQLSNWLDARPVRSLVVLIDEYDAPLAACLGADELFEGVSMIMRRFFAVFKSSGGCLRFFFMTGITKLSESGIFSEFNDLTDLTDISLDPAFGALLGFTEDEVKSCFWNRLEEAAALLDLPADETLARLKARYGGYCFDAGAQVRVLCPWSVLNFLASPQQGFVDYWFASGGHASVLLNYLQWLGLDDPLWYAREKTLWLRDMSAASSHRGRNRASLLFQAGYLTIGSVSANGVVELVYPNEEVAVSMAQLYADELLVHVPFRSKDNQALASVLETGGVQDVVRRFNDLLDALDHARRPIVDEAACAAYLQVLLTGAEMLPQVRTVLAQGEGVLEIDAGARRWVFEIKCAGGTQEAPGVLQEDALKLLQKHRGKSPRGGRELFEVALVFSKDAQRFVRWRAISGPGKSG